MLRLSQVTKPWKESAALNSHINLYGFWESDCFPHKIRRSGDGAAGIVSRPSHDSWLITGKPETNPVVPAKS
jgi:hypothetical protein